MCKRFIVACIILFTAIFFQKTTLAQESIQQYLPINFSNVNITDNFWKPKIDKISSVTIPVCVDQTEVKTPRIQNFEIAAGKKKGTFKGIFYDDSDVYKALEAIAYSLRNNPDPALEKKADQWINLIAGAQLSDGYINTYYSLQFPEKRWTDMSMHEDYCGGHLIEAAIAYFEATGKRALLDVAIRFANHFNNRFGPNKKDWVTGHQELELALVKLYKVTQNREYLNLADWLLSERGHQKAVGYTWTDWKDTAYAQDKIPVREQKEITGHAVRAMYMYTGAADVAAITGDQGYLRAMKTVWEDVVYRNMYITGGVGSSGSNEGFSKDYELPNEQAYCETCASVGMVFWNQRMGLLTGESKYIDVLEKSLYNGALDGISLKGDKFFYSNPLASNGNNARKDWFGTACCPSNIARLVASLGNYIYGVSENQLWINLYVGSNTEVKMGKTNVQVDMKTNYPWDGKISIALNPKIKTIFGVKLRIPGWILGEASPGGLYNFTNKDTAKFTVMLNGKQIDYTIDKGYVFIKRQWKAGDTLELNMPMDVQRIESRLEVKANVQRVALQRGPLLYCVEAADNSGKASNIVLPTNGSISILEKEILSEKIVALEAKATVLDISADGQQAQTIPYKITAIPYYTWSNRGNGQMQVWLPVKILTLKVN
jgi:DUF1680 family protein